MSSDDWSSLPLELLETIARKLIVVTDYIRFRAICTSWRISTPEIPTHLPCQFPWLMLSQTRYNSHRRTFATLSNNKLHYLNLPEASHPRRRCGSSYGWFTIVDESPRIFLINPLTRAKISLPPLSTFPNVVSFDFANVGREYVLRTLPNNHMCYTMSLRDMRDDFIKKTVLSDSPSLGSHFVALAIIRREGGLQLAYSKSGQNSWKLIEGIPYFEDVTYFNGLIYSVDGIGAMAVCNVCGDSPAVEIINRRNLNVFVGGDMRYLVNAMGELLLISRFMGFEHGVEDQYLRCKTVAFKVFRFDFNEINWELLKSLGDKVLFLGENSSLAFSASDYPGCRGNRIYFTDDFSKEDCEGLHGDHDMGIFNLEDGTVEPLPCNTRDSLAPLPWPPPVWVTPNPCS